MFASIHILIYIYQPHVREVRPLTSDIIVCDCSHEICPGVHA